MVLLIMLTCTACARHDGDARLRLLPSASGAQVRGDGPWWTHSGDALLDRLTAEALAAEPIPACEPPRASVGARLRGVFGTARVRAARSEAEARAWDNVAQRLARAQAIGLAYLRARSWQARLAQRLASPEILNDNALIARFRREAGLVPALDEDMAAIMLGLNGADADTARAGLSEAIAGLAHLTGQEPTAVRAMLDSAPYARLTAPPERDDPDVSARPDLHALQARLLASPPLQRLAPDAVRAQLQQAEDGKGPDWAVRWTRAVAHARQQANDARTKLAGARDQIGRREALADEANRAVINARLAYRNGAAGFATLYATEAAGMATREARIEAERAVAAALIDLWSAQGLGETAREGTCDGH